MGAGASLISGFMGSSAAKKAAAAQKASSDAAVAGVNKATTAGQQTIVAGQGASNDAITTGKNAATNDIASAGQTQASLYNNMAAPLQGYQDAGTYGLNKLQSSAGTFAAPTLAQAEATPGYQFQLQQGEKALNNSAATRGMLASGVNQKSNMGYAEGLASTDYNNLYQQALSTYNTNQAGYQSLANMGQTANSQGIQAGSIYGGQVTSLANMGANTEMQGAGMLSNTAMQGNEAIANMGMQGATTSGQFLTKGGDAQAAGIIGSANAWGGALNGVANAATAYGLNSMGNPSAPSGWTGAAQYDSTGNPVAGTSTMGPTVLPGLSTGGAGVHV